MADHVRRAHRSDFLRWPTKSRSADSIGFSNSSTGFQGYDAESGNNLNTGDQTFAVGSSNVAFTMAFTAANLQAFWMVANQNCTIKTNSTGSPANTINLIAGIPYFWGVSSGIANPFGTNITIAYMTCTPATRLQTGILTS